ncbi:MAG: transporter substrate-binding domain-containing protein [Spirochaetales bacterium]|nr:transporter substrate-binding domain-containing protein [Spirochaetales bacterium]MBP7264575.1 transporter substrate-binding domain-containing protein [Spirochaetia bacterium]
MRFWTTVGVMGLALAVAVAVFACAQGEPDPEPAGAAVAEPWAPDGRALALADRLRGQGGLRVATTLTEGIYEPRADGSPGGFMTLLAAEFARRLDLPLVIEVVGYDELLAVNGQPVFDDPPPDATPDIFSRVDMVVHALTPLLWREKISTLVPVVPNRILTVFPKGAQARGVQELSGKSALVIRRTSFEAYARDLVDRLGIDLRPELKPYDYDTIGAVVAGEADFTFRDAFGLASVLMTRGDITVGPSVSEQQSLCWALQKGNDELESALRSFLDSARLDGTLRRLWSDSFRMTYDEYEILARCRDIAMPAITEAQAERISELRRSGLRAALDADLTVYESRPGLPPAGYHYALLARFAETFGIELVVETVSFQDFWTAGGALPERVKTDPKLPWTPDLIRRVDMYVAPFTPLPWREKFLRFVPVFPSTLVWIFREDDRVESIADLEGRPLCVLADSSYEPWLAERLAETGVRPVVTRTQSMGQSVDLVATGAADATLADSSFAVAWLRGYATLAMYPASKTVDELSWGVKKDDEELAGLLRAWLDAAKARGAFEDVWYDYHGSSFAEYLGVVGR